MTFLSVTKTLLTSAFVASLAHAFMGPKVVTTTRSSVSSPSLLRMVADDAKVILVTGSSRGLGRSIALDLGQHGQKVVVNYVSDGSKASAEETCEAIKKSGGDAFAVQADSTYLLEIMGSLQPTSSLTTGGRQD